MASHFTRGPTGRLHSRPAVDLRRALLLAVLVGVSVVLLLQNGFPMSTRSGAGPGPGADTAPAPHVSGNRLVDGAGRPLRLLGVNFSGTEDACVLDRGFSWAPMDVAQARQIATWQINAVRVPLNEDCWLGVNGVPRRYSGANYRVRIRRWVRDLNAAGIIAVLDLHWSAPGSIEARRQWPLPDASHAFAFWEGVARSFSADRSVIFDLFNEPFIGRSRPTSRDWSCWLYGCDQAFQVVDDGRVVNVAYRSAGMQPLVDAVRATGATQPIMLGGLNWAGDPCGLDDAGGDDGSCAWLTYEPTDPLDQLIASFHTYNWTACSTTVCWNADIAPLAARVPVITGELGEAGCSTAFIRRYVDWADQHDVSYLVWDWQTAESSSKTCDSNAFSLISNWSGSPNQLNPVGTFLRSHLRAVRQQR